MKRERGTWAQCPQHCRRSYDCMGVNTMGVLFRCKGDSLIPDSQHIFVSPLKATEHPKTKSKPKVNQKRRWPHRA